MNGGKSFTVRDLPVEERPRERLMKYGAEAVSAQELLAVILGRGTAGHSVMQIAQDLIATFGSLEKIVGASLTELQTISGLGPAKALQLKACLEVARRVLREEVSVEEAKNGKTAVATPEHIARLVRSRVRNFAQEHFFVISLDNRNRVLGVNEISIGTLNAGLVHPRETFNAALRHHAASIIVCHNHPSGDPQPSEADLSVTTRLVEAGQIMGVRMVDHVIVCKTELYSFRKSGVL